LAALAAFRQEGGNKGKDFHAGELIFRRRVVEAGKDLVSGREKRSAIKL
jgi:hypothetical protein